MAIRSSVRHHKSLRERARILAAYEDGHMTQEEVAAHYDIALSTLQRWRRHRQAAPPVGRADLVEVPNLLEAGGAGAPYRVRFARGLVLEVRAGFEPGEVRWLAELLHRL